ncbi:MAG: hypothetical protein HOV81_34830 [Kofleriaceae bacterium]|nr:hypothetical protein [Kofleriaceae bacterium]
MPTLSEHINVYGTALQVLKDKGYQLWFEPETRIYRAERDGWDFAAHTPCGLLGVVAIFEHRQPTKYEEYWWRKEEVDELALPHEPRPYNSVLATQGRGPRPPRHE